ncbi:MAG: energy transducer TonB [Terracidiphilus sp.]
MKRLIVLLCLCACANLGRAQTRWCSSAPSSASTYFFYPAMARMEKIQGVVIGRVTILPGGRVERVEIVSGPPVLAKALHDQMMKWTLRAETDNDEACQTLVIADFKISSPYGKNLLDEPKAAPPGVMRLLVEADDAAEHNADRADAQGAPPPDNLESSSRRP